MSLNEEGRIGEERARQWLIRKGLAHFQLDWIAELPTGSYLSIESKYQERFVAPPFDGHGLPPRQVEARLRFGEATGVRPVLFVYDKETHEIFWQYLADLEAGTKYQTNGGKPRRIYPIEAFNVG